MVIVSRISAFSLRKEPYFLPNFSRRPCYSDVYLMDMKCHKVAHLALRCLSAARALNCTPSRSVVVRFYVIHVIYRKDECMPLVPFSSPINSCHLALSVMPFEVRVLSA